MGLRWWRQKKWRGRRRLGRRCRCFALVRLHDIDEVERQLFRSCFSTLGDGWRVSKVGGLQSVNSWFQATLLIDPVDDFAFGGVATYSFTQELADAGVVVLLHGSQQVVQSGLEYVPRQMVFIRTHDHRVLGGNDVVADE